MAQMFLSESSRRNCLISEDEMQKRWDAAFGKKEDIAQRNESGKQMCMQRCGVCGISVKELNSLGQCEGCAIVAQSAENERYNGQ